ncbi:hypothetical protein GOARA_061_00100 [Gordonia araii NBRC 100433]|uniref:MarR family transcriptional regulator n=1 Tax=Gordonia araii NBRC 100433 TaxID=1073574 RepID=G7H3Z6_9ACTN|nr:hypothetical protein [Gordonia araii]NNG96364.1 hypothetical protein [Gordonia araii NBRC 100433]GAB10571.1 hypothetical protein GOARA_061_00100 [Gordonia araii NBRC 100433]
MNDQRPLPALVGATENTLRALLTATLSTTPIKTYPAWVVLSAAPSHDTRDATAGHWLARVSEVLKVEPGLVDEVLTQLNRDGLVTADNSLTPRGEAELSSARIAVATATAKLIEGVNSDDEATVRRVLDQMRLKAEELLTA